jgi:hypothetical protein
MKKTVTLIAISLFFSVSGIVKAQSEKQTGGFRYDNLSFNLSYYGETVWYPGLKAGAEYVISEKKKEKVKNSKRKGEYTKTKINQFIVTANLGYFWQPHNFGSVFLNTALLYRHTGNRGFQYNLGISPLGMNTFFFNETYNVSDDGTVEKAVMPARIFYSPSLVFGLGHTMKKKTLTAWFLNFHLTGLIPYNNAVNLLMFAEFGFRFNIDKFDKNN